MNGRLKQVVDAWPILAAFTAIMGILLLAYAKVFIGEIISADIATTPTIIAMDKAIADNKNAAENGSEGIERIEAKLAAMDQKIDNLVTIMLTED